MAGESQEDYDLMPHYDVAKLRRDVEEIKTNPLGSTSEAKALLEAMNRLSQSMDHLVGLFQEAAEQMKLEEREAELIGKKMDPLFGKMDELIDQNSKIAKGIIAVADMVKENTARGRMQPQQAPRPYPQQPFSPGIRVEPTSMPPNPPQMGQNTAPMPPMPPPQSSPPKKGFFSLGKK